MGGFLCRQGKKKDEEANGRRVEGIKDGHFRWEMRHSSGGGGAVYWSFRSKPPKLVYELFSPCQPPPLPPTPYFLAGKYRYIPRGQTLLKTSITTQYVLCSSSSTSVAEDGVRSSALKCLRQVVRKRLPAMVNAEKKEEKKLENARQTQPGNMVVDSSLLLRIVQSNLRSSGNRSS